ncbi:hypothetical protein ACOMHN_036256 [Nucella lapillus]
MLLCLLTLPLLALASPVGHAAIKPVSAAFSPAHSYKSMKRYGGYGALGGLPFGGAFAPGFPYGAGPVGLAGLYGGNLGPYGLQGAGQYFHKQAGYGLAGGFPAAGGYMKNGMYPALGGKQYNALAAAQYSAALLGSGALYGKYGGVAGGYMKQPAGLNGYGLGYPGHYAGTGALYGGKHMAAAGYGPLAYAGAPGALYAAKTMAGGYGYGSVNMLGKTYG